MGHSNGFKPVACGLAAATAWLISATAAADLLIMVQPAANPAQTEVRVGGSAQTTDAVDAFGGDFGDFLRPDVVDLTLGAGTILATGSNSGTQSPVALHLHTTGDGIETLSIQFPTPFLADETVVFSGSSIIDQPLSDLFKDTLRPAQIPLGPPATLYVRSPQALQVIAVTGESAPGDQSVFFRFDERIVTDEGSISFFARLADPLPGSGFSGRGIYTAGDAPLRVSSLIRTGDTPTQLNGMVSDLDSSTLRMNQHGVVMAQAGVTPQTPDAPQERVLFASSDGALVPLFRQGDVAPDGSGVIPAAFDALGDAHLSDDGEVVALVSYGEPVNTSRSLVATSIDNPMPSMLLPNGSVLPGSGNNVAALSWPRRSASGDVFVDVNGGLDTDMDSEIYRWRNGNLTRIFGAGDVPNGTSDPVTAIDLVSTVGEQGSFLATGTLSGTNSVDQSLLFFDGSGQPPTVVMRTNAALPGLGDVLSFIEVSDTTADGRVVIGGGASDGSELILGVDAAGSHPRALVRFGEALPLIDDIPRAAFDMRVNAQGEFVVSAFASPEEAPDEYSDALLFGSGSTPLIPAVQSGDALLGSVVTHVQLGPEQIGGPNDFNRRGQTVFNFTLADGRSGIALWTPPGRGPDADEDGIEDFRDNCLTIANADQRDTNADGFGNACDPDLNNDGVVNFLDLGQMRTVFFSGDADADFNGDGTVNVIDLGRLRQFFFLQPGPSGVAP